MAKPDEFECPQCDGTLFESGYTWRCDSCEFWTPEDEDWTMKPRKRVVSRRAVSKLPGKAFRLGESSREHTAKYVAEFNRLNGYSQSTTF